MELHRPCYFDCQQSILQHTYIIIIEQTIIYFISTESHSQSQYFNHYPQVSLLNFFLFMIIEQQQLIDKYFGRLFKCLSIISNQCFAFYFVYLALQIDGKKSLIRTQMNQNEYSVLVVWEKHSNGCSKVDNSNKQNYAFILFQNELFFFTLATFLQFARSKSFSSVNGPIDTRMSVRGLTRLFNRTFNLISWLILSLYSIKIQVWQSLAKLYLQRAESQAIKVFERQTRRQRVYFGLIQSLISRTACRSILNFKSVFYDFFISYEVRYAA